MECLLVTGKTYEHRRTLRGMGGLFDYEEKGYWLPVSKLDEAKALSGVACEIVERDTDPLAPMTPDQLREYRQAKIDRKRARLIDRADRAAARSDKAYNKISPHEREFLRLGEPVKIGHHSEGRHRRLIERVDSAMEKSCKEAAYASELRQRANWMMDAQVKGDAERRRDAKRAAVLSQIAVGDTVHDLTFGDCLLVKIYDKSASIQAKDGNRHSVPIHWLKLVAKGTGEVPKEAKPVRKFKKGDRAMWKGPHGTWQTPVLVEVLRVTPIRYKVRMVEGDIFKDEPVRESHLIPLDQK